MKQKTISKLKKELWKVFSLYIKLKYQTDEGWTYCYTCNKPLKIGTSDCQGGHCLTKKGYPGHYFNENNVRPQCYHCNINLGGNITVFVERLKDEIGEDEYIKMYNKRHESIKLARCDYMDLIQIYTSKVEDIRSN